MNEQLNWVTSLTDVEKHQAVLSDIVAKNQKISCQIEVYIQYKFCNYNKIENSCVKIINK